MKKLFDSFVYAFGYSNFEELYNSMFHKKLLIVVIPLAGLVSFIESWLGIEILTIIAFLFTMVLEVVTGISASIKENKVITSRKFSRFGLKAFIWFSFLFIINTFKIQYQDKSYVASQFWGWAHSAFISYITLEYLISIDENIGRITGKKSGFVEVIRKKFGDFFNSSNSENLNHNEKNNIERDSNPNQEAQG